MKIAVVTPYHKEDIAIIRRCHESVATQTFACRHILVADGFPLDPIDRWNSDHIKLPQSHGDIGSTARVIGSFNAIGSGFDGIAFLDADNWYGPEHIAKLLELYRSTAAPFLSSSRYLCRLDGSVMGLCHMSDGRTFVDTSCMLLMRPAFGLIQNWCLMPDYAHIIGDRVFFYLAKASGVQTAHLDLPTLYYRCSKAGNYDHFGEQHPPGVQPRPDYDTAFRRWVAEGNPPLI